MSYDRADYDLAKDTVRIAFFVTWAMLNGLAGQLHLEDDQELLAGMHGREIAPGYFFIVVCDCKFVEADLSDEGDQFVRAYYLHHRKRSGYYEDYARVLLSEFGLPELVVDCWENYEKIAPVITGRYEQWKNGKK